MAGITAAQASVQLGLYQDAEKAVLLGQSYTIGERTLKRADLEEIRKGISYYNNLCVRLNKGGISFRRAIPRDF